MFVRFDGWNDIGVRFPWFWRPGLGYFQSPMHKDNPSQRYYSVFVLNNGRTVTLTGILRSMYFIRIEDSSIEYWTRVCSVPVKVKSYVTNLMQFLKTCVTDMSSPRFIWYCYSGAITNLVLTLAPTTMLNGEGKPTTPIQHFKRHMYSPDDDDIEEAERDIVTVQIKGKKVIIPLPSSLIPLELGKSSTMLCRIHYFLSTI